MLNVFEKLSIFRGMIQYVQGQSIYASKGNGIYISQDFGNHWELLFNIPLPPLKKLCSLTKLSRRLFRTDVHHLLCLDNDTLVIVAYGSIYTYDLKNKRLNANVTPIYGSRPLTLCKDNNSVLYYGEYRSNVERTPIHIYCSEDFGCTWQSVYEFTNVRHVHGVFYDPYEDTLWVTTGDQDSESAIWRSRDRFKTLEKVIGGSQQMRAVQLIFSQDFVYFGSDTPLEKNYIYRLNKKTNKTEKLQAVEGSVFWGCKVGNAMFFSTAVEPSIINECHHACIWSSSDGENWQCIARFRKDIWPMKLFQYGQVLFPYGENQTPYLWFSPMSCEYDQYVMKGYINEVN